MHSMIDQKNLAAVGCVNIVIYLQLILIELDFPSNDSPTTIYEEKCMEHRKE